jgi:hypothetical protein
VLELLPEQKRILPPQLHTEKQISYHLVNSYPTKQVFPIFNSLKKREKWMSKESEGRKTENSCKENRDRLQELAN